MSFSAADVARINFNPRAPRGARLEYSDIRKAYEEFQSTCPARGTPQPARVRLRGVEISIHVPREGHDYLQSRSGDSDNVFQSTCPARGTTNILVRNPVPEGISIHVPREGHDRGKTRSRVGGEDFNPRAPRGARPQYPNNAEVYSLISIHVPREGHDSSVCSRRPRASYFNPRAPRGARREMFSIEHLIKIFQSTCPARGTTRRLQKSTKIYSISIHVPREGHDQQAP